MPNVQTPDGKVIQFPDSMSTQEINNVLDKQYGGKTAPTPQPSDMSGLEKFGVGVGYGMKQAGQGALQAVLEGGQWIRNKLGLESNQSNVDKLQAMINSDKQAFSGLNDSWAAKGGELVGGTLPTLAMPGGAETKLIQRLLASGAQGATIGALQPTTGNESRLSNTLVGGAAGAGTSAALTGLSKIIPVAGRVAKETFGATTGTGPGAVEEAVKGGQAFKDALRGKITGQDVVDTAKDALNTIKDKRGDAYRQKLAEVTDNNAPIDLSEIKNAVTEKLKSFVKYTEPETPSGFTKAVKNTTLEATPYPTGGGFSIKDADGQFITSKGHAIFFKDQETAQTAVDEMMKRTTANIETETANAAIPKQTIPTFNWSRTTVGDIKTSQDAKELKQIYSKIQNWGSQPGDNTAVELDRLRRDLDNYWSDSSRVRAFVADARNTVSDAIKKNVPEYAEMTKGYAEATSLIKDIEKTLSLNKSELGGRATADQTLRRLTSSMRENFEMRRDIVETLGTQGGADVAGQIAGYSMNQIIPRGLIGKIGAGSFGYIAYLNPKLWPILAASSPRVMGEFLMAFGKAHKAVSALPAIPTGNILPKAAAVESTQLNNNQGNQ